MGSGYKGRGSGYKGRGSGYKGKWVGVREGEFSTKNIS